MWRKKSLIIEKVAILVGKFIKGSDVVGERIMNEIEDLKREVRSLKKDNPQSKCGVDHHLIF